MAQDSEQLRREAEETRAQLADTLEELRARITPGQVVDQLVDYAGDSDAGECFRNLGRQAAKNPIPVTLMGAGLAWLMLAGKSGPSTDRIAQRGRDLASGTADTLGRWGSAARGTASGWRATGSRMPDETSAHRRDASSRVSQAADEAGSAAAEVGENAAAGYGDIREQARSAYGAATEKAAAAYGAVSDKAGSAYEAMSDKAAAAYEDASAAAARAAAAARDRTQAMRQSAADASRSILDFCKEQPLISAGLGLALGAAIGAALPSTRKEIELMGEASDRL